MHSKVDSTAVEFILEKDKEKIYPMRVTRIFVLLSCIFYGQEHHNQPFSLG